MIATHTHQAPRTNLSIGFSSEFNSNPQRESDPVIGMIESLNITTPFLLPGRIVTHHPKAGVNPLVDAASYLFSVLGKLKQIDTYRQFGKLQKQLIQEIQTFQENSKRHGYSTEYLVVCHYIICATFDDILGNTAWGGQGQWDNVSLLTAFKQDRNHQSKFFSILERALREPTLYIDLMEFIYICLSLGYKGPYRATEHSHFQLEQITNNLYKHIRTYRGNISKALSPMPMKMSKTTTKSSSQGNTSLLTMTIMTACAIMATFISLGYLMDVISNESFETIAQINTQVSHQSLA